MSVQRIPEGYHSVTPYVIVGGVAKVIDFLKTVFDGKEKERMETPDGRIMHAEVTIDGSVIMMGEPAGEFQAMPGSMYVYVSDVDATYDRAVAAGASSVMKPADQFYGDRNAGVKDSSGNIWWIATHIEDVPPDELAKRAAAAQK